MLSFLFAASDAFEAAPLVTTLGFRASAVVASLGKRCREQELSLDCKEFVAVKAGFYGEFLRFNGVKLFIVL